MVDPAKTPKTVSNKKPAEAPKQEVLKKSKRTELKDPHFKLIAGPVAGQKSVIIQASAYKSVVLYASRYANPSIPQPEWKEIYGIMIGYIDKEKNKIIVTRCEPITSGESTDVQLRSEHYGQIEEIQTRLDQEGKGEWIVGWWHSHPGLSLFYSYVDLSNHLYFQSVNADACGLVFDHTLIQDRRIQDRPLGFEIFRMKDTTIDPGDPAFEDNYTMVEWEIEGMDEYFFANVLSELSSKYSAGKPLEMSYGEKISDKKKGSQAPTPQKIESDFAQSPQDVELTPLEEIIRKTPMANLDSRDPILRPVAEGNQAFENGDSFTGGEKYKQAIEILVKEKRKQELVTTLSDAAALSIHASHFQLVKDFARKLLKYAEETGSLVHMGQAHYSIGVAYLREKENATKGLEYMQQASISFEKSGEFVVSGLCNQIIGDYYLSQQNLFSACLFYIEAIKFYQKGRHESPLLQKLSQMDSGDVEKKMATLSADLKKNFAKLAIPQERNKLEGELKKLNLM